MKIIILVLFIAIYSCGNNNSAQIKIYEDSAIYFSNKWKAILDSGFSKDDSIYQIQKTEAFIYKTMRQHYIDKMEELKR